MTRAPDPQIPADPVFEVHGIHTLNVMKLKYVKYILQVYDGRKDLAANALRVSIRTLYTYEKQILEGACGS